MKISAQTHLDNCLENLNEVIAATRKLISETPKERLSVPEAEGKWNMLQCVKHMSIAADVYVKNLEEEFSKPNHAQASDEFRSHWKGDMFTNMISPKEGDVKNKMKTFKSMDPEKVLAFDSTFQEFLVVHEKLLNLIKKSNDFDLNRTKIPTALGPLVKLRLGDALRFVIGHAQRHVLQLKRIQTAVS